MPVPFLAKDDCAPPWYFIYKGVVGDFSLISSKSSLIADIESDNFSFVSSPSTGCLPIFMTGGSSFSALGLLGVTDFFDEVPAEIGPPSELRVGLPALNMSLFSAVS